MERSLTRWQVPLQPVGSWEASAVLRPLFGTMSYLLPGSRPPPRSRDKAREIAFTADEDFWRQVIDDQLIPGMRVLLDRFVLFDWFPRAPGLYHAPHAKWVRDEALQYRMPSLEQGKPGVHREPSTAADYTVVLAPRGKLSMLEGGVGCVRLRPIPIEGTLHWLVSASSAGVAHAGIPIAIPQDLYLELLADIRGRKPFCARVRGTLAFPPDPFSRLFDAAARMPRLYVKVDAVERCRPKPRLEPEATVAVSFVSAFEGTPRTYATYVTFRPDIDGSFDEAVDWMKDVYVEGTHRGRILTDFDQTRTIFPEARLALDRVMRRHVSRGELQEVLELMQLQGAADRLFDEIDRANLLPPAGQAQRDTVFISYSHAAEQRTGWVKRIRTHLGALPPDKVEVWDDSRIRPGDRWRAEIDAALRRARVAIVVLTPDFLASSFIRESELPALLSAAEAGGAQVLCVYGGDVHLSGDAARLEQYQFVNDMTKPLQGMAPAEREAVFKQLAASVDRIVQHGR
ncbi:toll/interleukin-1 receptor domain-containing protein [Aquabacterium humicola]|uniref:toll/interleukin-1 receptor domain-containing protein n=1 Tax=Aquabacterium humicola TaxID=3237377 RepID=UPI002543916D|nr:toll/interleukin-1 receptor domain-containing protein [Rubrivivax pictus]